MGILRRLLGLLSTLVGTAVGVMTQVGADEAEINFCKWAKKWFPGLPDACLPSWALYLICAVLVVGGLLWFFWPRTDRAQLKISGPYPLSDPPARMRWRMKVHNTGRAAAANVQMTLRDITPRPGYQLWFADYPYPVERPGLAADAPASRISPGDEQDYEIVAGWRSGDGEYFTSLDTRLGERNNPIRIGPDERWELSYEVTAENAKRVKFALAMYVENRAVIVKEKA